MIRLAFFLFLLASPVADAATITVVDGDTVRAGGALVRIVGLNAPETGGRALCARERRLGVIARARLRQILDGGNPVELRLVPCACKAGTEGTRK
jgi:micrococcal nuclease